MGHCIEFKFGMHTDSRIGQKPNIVFQFSAFLLYFVLKNDLHAIHENHGANNRHRCRELGYVFQCLWHKLKQAHIDHSALSVQPVLGAKCGASQSSTLSCGPAGSAGGST